MLLSLLIVVISHTIAFAIFSHNDEHSEPAHNMPYSDRTVVATDQRFLEFLEIELKEYPITIADSDIIELIELVEQNKTNEPKPAAQKSLDKNTQEKKDMPESKGITASFKQDYIGGVIAKLSKNKHYPTSEHNRGHEGSVTIRFTIDPNGEARNLEVRKASPYPNLDKAALDTVRKSNPFPKFEDYTESIDIALTLDYKIEY